MRSQGTSKPQSLSTAKRESASALVTLVSEGTLRVTQSEIGKQHMVSGRWEIMSGSHAGYVLSLYNVKTRLRST